MVAIPVFAQTYTISPNPTDNFYFVSVSYPDSGVSTYSCDGLGLSTGNGVTVILYDGNGNYVSASPENCGNIENGGYGTYIVNYFGNQNAGNYTFVVLGNQGIDYSEFNDFSTTTLNSITTESATVDGGSQDPDFGSINFTITNFNTPTLDPTSLTQNQVFTSGGNDFGYRDDADCNTNPTLTDPNNNQYSINAGCGSIVYVNLNYIYSATDYSQIPTGIYYMYFPTQNITSTFNVVIDNSCTLNTNYNLNSSTLGCTIDKVNSGVTGYVYTLIAHYWPFVVGVGVLVGVWHFGMVAITLF